MHIIAHQAKKAREGTKRKSWVTLVSLHTAMLQGGRVIVLNTAWGRGQGLGLSALVSMQAVDPPHVPPSVSL